MKPSTYRPNTSNSNTAHKRGSSSGTADVQTIAIESMTSAILVTVETTAARVTFDNSDPSAASAPSMVIQKDSVPVLIPVGAGSTIKWVSTAAAASVVQVLELI